MPPNVTWQPIQPTGAIDYLVVVETGDGGTANKEIDFDTATGTWSKHAAAERNYYRGTVHHVPTGEVLKATLETMDDTRASVLGSIPGLEAGTVVHMVSARKMRDMLGMENPPKGVDPPAPLGLYTFRMQDSETGEVAGHIYLCRVVENLAPSTWRNFDFDATEHTPEQWRRWSPVEWRAVMDPHAVGLGAAEMVVTRSNSSRVEVDGKPVMPASGSFHSYVRMPEGADLSWVVVVRIRSITNFLSYCKPIVSRTGEKEGQKIGQRFEAPFDSIAAKSSNRLSFECPPRLRPSAVAAGAVVTAATVEVVPGGVWDCTAVTPLTPENRDAYRTFTGETVEQR